MPSRLPLPADFAEHAHRPKPELAKRYGVSTVTIQRWRIRIGKPGRQDLARPIPPRFAEMAARMSGKALGEHYNAPWRVVRRWCREAGVEAKHCRSDATPAPDDLEQRAADMTQAEMERHYGVSHFVVARWLREAGIRSKPYVKPSLRPVSPGPARPVGRPPSTPRSAPQRAGREEEAAQYLRRWDFVFRCRDKGGADPQGKFWRFGNVVLTGAELVARAEAKGFNPDEWRTIASTTIRADALPSFPRTPLEGGRHG